MKKLGFLATAILSVVGVLALGESVSAARQLTMSPGSSDTIVLEAGMSQNGSFMLYNTGDEDVNIEVKPAELCVNESYTFTFEGCTVASSTTMKNWITVSAEKTTLKPGEETKVSYTVNVPTSGLPGGSQHAGITTTFEGTAESLGTRYVLGYKLFAWNPIGARVDSTLVSAKVDRLQFKRPLSARMVAKNDGNVDFFAKSTMTVSTLGGKEVFSTGELNHVVMPGTTREVTAGWDGAPHLGLFKVKYDVRLESVDGNLLESKTIEKTVLIMPLFLFVVILVVIAALVVFLVIRLKKNAELKNARRY
jgi:hypothetical protein